MRIVILVVVFVMAAIAVGGTLALIFNEPISPPELTSVTRALDAVDFSVLPEAQTFKARDGTPLVFRAYPGRGNDTVVLIHGATLTSASMHVVATALQTRGATAYSLGMRGHEGGGRKGDVDYIGQLADDIDDFMQTLPPKKTGERRILVGFSAGGGLALTFAGSPEGKAFDRLLLVAPALAYNAPTARPGFGGLVNAAMPRIIVLFALNQLGVTAFNKLPTTAFATPEGAKYSTTRVYTFRMAASFGADPRFLESLSAAPGSVVLIVGGADEVFFADQYEPLLRPSRPDIDLTVIPGLNHMETIVKPVGVDLIASKALAP